MPEMAKKKKAEEAQIAAAEAAERARTAKEQELMWAAARSLNAAEDEPESCEEVD